MSKEINDALIQITNLEESIKKNAQGILASTMKEEIKSLVKESLLEQDEVEVEDEEEVTTPEGGQDGSEDDSDEVEVYSDEEEDDDEMSGIPPATDDTMDDVTMSDDAGDEDVMDARNLDNAAVVDIFKKMGPNDQIEVVKDDDEVYFKDGENEYIIKLNESSDMNEEMYEMDFPGSTEVYEDMNLDEDDLNDGVVYELELDEELDEMDNLEMDENFGDKILDFEFEDDFETPKRFEDDFETPKRIPKRISRLDREMFEMDHMSMDEMENFDDLPKMKMGGLRESKNKIHKTKGTGSASKFKYGKKPNQDKGFDTKMKQGTRGVGMGKASKFKYEDTMDGEYKPVKKKMETKEATRSNNYVKSGKVGNRKGSNMNRNRTEVRQRPNNVNEEVSLLRQKNEEYKNALDVFRTKINEVAVFNSNLAYATRLFTEHSTTKQEKINILRRFDNIESLKESKNLYKQIKEELGTSVVNESTNLNESRVERKVMNNINTGSSTNLIESTTYENPQFMRMKDLMNKIK
jgi:hypothetical protein